MFFNFQFVSESQDLHRNGEKGISPEVVLFIVRIADMLAKENLRLSKVSLIFDLALRDFFVSNNKKKTDETLEICNN